MQRCLLAGLHALAATVVLAGLALPARAQDDLPRINGPLYSSNQNPYWTNLADRYECTWYVWGRCNEAGWPINCNHGADAYPNGVTNGNGHGLAPAVGAIMCSTSLSVIDRTTLVYHVSYVVQVDSPTQWWVAQYNVIPYKYSYEKVTRANATTTALSGGGFGSQSQYTLTWFLYPPTNLQPPASPPPSPSATSFTPGVVTDTFGLIHVFARTTSGAIYTIVQSSPNGGWNPWSNLGGILAGNPVPALNKDGRIEFAVRGTDGVMYHMWQTSAGGPWSSWGSFGGILASDPAMAVNADGRIEFAVLGTNQNLYDEWQTVPGGGWQGWSSFGGVLASKPASGVNPDGRIEDFAVGTDGAMYHIWQTFPGGGWSPNWGSLGGILGGDPVVLTNPNGPLNLFCRGTNNVYYQKAQHSDGTWSDWVAIHPEQTFFSNPIVGIDRNGLIVVVGIGSDRQVYFTRLSSSGWNSWTSLGGQLTGDPAMGRNQDGRLQVVARGTDGAMYQVWEQTNGIWSSWAALGDGVSRF